MDGYYQQLCIKGHYTTRDAHDWKHKDECTKCNDKIIWRNFVNTSSGKTENYINMRHYKLSNGRYLTPSTGTHNKE